MWGYSWCLNSGQSCPLELSIQSAATYIAQFAPQSNLGLTRSYLRSTLTDVNKFRVKNEHLD